MKFGDVLEIELGAKARAVRRPLAADEFARAPGGTSLGVALLDAALDPHALARGAFDPLGPENVLVFAAGPFAGTPVPAATKHAIVTVSPLTGFVSDGLSSSHWSGALRALGLAAIVVRGSAPAWSILAISHAGVELRDASALLGRSAADVEAALGGRASGGEGAVRAASIGLAGERLVPFATIENDGRQAGRGGAGAVLGSKRIKAIVLATPPAAERGGAAFERFADPPRARASIDDLRARMLGPATAKYRTTGTGANLRALARMGMLPAKNFTTVAFDGVERVAPERAREERDAYREIRDGCAGCPIQCEHRYVRRGGDARSAGASEYESVWAFGPNCGVDDLDAVLDAIARCDRLGLDTISTGAVIGFAMECTERGLLAGDLFDVPLRFGNAAVLAPAIEAIARGRDSGSAAAPLALGVRALAARLGPEAERFAMHAKGLEFPGYEPRALPTYALALAVCTRGACHNRAAAYDRDLRDPERAPLDAPDVRAAAVIEAEDDAILWDALVLCKFTRHALGDLAELGSQLLAAVRGIDLAPDDLRRAARATWSRKRALNERLGWTAADDVLPARAYEPLDAGPYAGRALERDVLDVQRAIYERLREAAATHAVNHDA